jgi:uncharacterized membrane protein
MTQSSHEPPAAPRGMDWLDAASILGIGAMTAAALSVWRLGPTGPMPMHFNLAGEVDRWGDRTEMALVMGGITLLATAVSFFCARAERAEQAGEGRGSGGRFTYRFSRMIMLLVASCVVSLLTAIAFDGPPQSEAAPAVLRWTMAGLSLLFLILGAFVGKARPNPILGVRTYWSLTSRLAWDKSNRLAGRLFAGLGLVGLVGAPLLPQPLGFQGMIAGLLLSAVWSIVESWRVWRIDPDRVRRA